MEAEKRPVESSDRNIPHASFHDRTITMVFRDPFKFIVFAPAVYPVGSSTPRIGRLRRLSYSQFLFLDPG